MDSKQSQTVGSDANDKNNHNNLEKYKIEKSNTEAFFGDPIFQGQLYRAASVANLLQTKSHWISIQLVWLQDLETLAVIAEKLELPDCARSQTTLIVPLGPADAIPGSVLCRLAPQRKSDALDVLFAFVDPHEEIIFYRVSVSSLFSNV